MAELRPRQFLHLYLGTDHAGFVLKEDIKAWLQTEGFVVDDCGAYELQDDDDFPDFILPVAEAVAAAVRMGEMTVAAIIFGGSGQGEAIAANHIPHVRAAVYYGGDATIVPLSRAHNNANVLSLGARFVAADDAKAVIWEWLHTPALTDPKYNRRNEKIDKVTGNLN